MRLLSHFVYGGLFAAVALAATSCLSAPSYPDTPRIDENSVTVTRLAGNLGLRDSIEIALNFQDGDGDLGLDAGDTTGIYAYNKGRNRFYENYFIQLFYKDKSNNFVPLLSADYPQGVYNGRYPRLAKPDAKAGPLKGVLRRSIVLPLDTAYIFRSGTEYRFEVSIADRALHVSNVVTTAPKPL